MPVWVTEPPVVWGEKDSGVDRPSHCKIGQVCELCLGRPTFPYLFQGKNHRIQEKNGFSKPLSSSLTQFFDVMVGPVLKGEKLKKNDQ